jgi:putative ABC transport system permease protein
MTPPRLPQHLIAWLVDSRLADAITGDLAETFLEESRGAPLRAWFRYWRRAVGAIWHLHHVRQRPGGDATMTTMLSDLVRGLRLFVTQPAYSLAAVVTLALAIGANTVIFSIANILVVKPLPLHDPGRLGWIQGTTPNSVEGRAGVSLPEYATFRDEVTALTQLAAWRRYPVTLRDQGQSVRVLGMQVIGDVQTLWKLSAVRGRALIGADEQAGAPQVVVLSHQFWTNRFAQSDDVVGREVYVDGEPHRIAGVLAPDIELGNLAEIDVWVPYRGDPALATRSDRGWRPVGRLDHEDRLAEADAQVTAIATRLSREWPETNRDFVAHAVSTRQALAGTNTWLVLALLALVVGLLLLLACANVMNLLIARLIGRRQELAVRTALGATRARVVRQIVSEGLLLGLAGGALGLALAWAGLQAIHAVAAEPIFRQIAIDVRVVGFAVLLSLIAPLAFSVVPALRILGEDVRAGLGEGTLRTIGGAASARGRSALVVLQVTLAVTLLVVASLAVQSMQAILHADPGFDPARLLITQIDVPTWKTPDDADALRLRQQLLTRLAAIPGAERVALATELPAMSFAPEVRLAIDGQPAASAMDEPRAYMTVVSAEYFRVLDVPMLAGRDFEAVDAASARPVAVVSQEAARRFWGGPAQAVGATVRVLDASGPAFEAQVIGVSRTITDPDLPEVPRPAIVVLDEHRPTRRTHILLRSAAPGALAGALRAAVAEVDPDLPTYQLRTMAAAVADENSSNQVLTGMFVAFAAVAMLLATAGLYGVIAYAVSQRSGEIAIRLALGAPATAIARQVVGHSLRLAALGTGIGLIGAYALARLIRSILYGVTPSDPATYAGAVALTLAAALVATWLPMRRAASIDPIESLRRG